MEKFKIEIKWGFIFAGSLLLWMVLERLAGLHDEHIDKHAYVTMLYAVVAIALYVFALKDKRKNYYNGVMSYREAFMTGLGITIVVTILSPVTQWIISYVITPDYFENVIQYSLKSGYYETEEAARAQFNFESYVIQSTISAFVMGVLTSAVVGYFIRRKEPSS